MTKINKGINICGNQAFEGKFMTNIDVEIPHVQK